LGWATLALIKGPWAEALTEDPLAGGFVFVFSPKAKDSSPSTISGERATFAAEGGEKSRLREWATFQVGQKKTKKRKLVEEKGGAGGASIQKVASVREPHGLVSALGGPTRGLGHRARSAKQSGRLENAAVLRNHQRQQKKRAHKKRVGFNGIKIKNKNGKKKKKKKYKKKYNEENQWVVHQVVEKMERGGNRIFEPATSSWDV